MCFTNPTLSFLPLPSSPLLLFSNQVRGLQLSDPDLGLDLVRVRVTTRAGGFLWLKTEATSRLDFSSNRLCRAHAPHWQCQGNGFSDRVMDFVADPESAAEALSELRFRTSFPLAGQDAINVTVFDGVGAEAGCLRESLHGERGTLYRGMCHVRSVELNVQVSF